ncbi:hypothetical protein SM007_36695 [Streptomyces avermitilis]|uniref:Lipoprotein n=1 Tax=Streptomyces avermitilis TaxID=33903 RepID=A0A4D4MI45_STRAX|nr:DUF4097 family beta strand repeat-containing protein [Streptomyces avermitilis]OOV18049.1 hypothetical protein SM007_36695 [Streptomyces avermitilis]BBJ56047.1 lipoprotein [Streptomyces avermitilis]GDY67991.1 lipoprotein [Streptomyces avermitilis]GDY71678.1 lipoprotein [Streptomyces avermitilis]GDY80864.1 lipoprotein [Streptomyces avermitilis]
MDTTRSTHKRRLAALLAAVPLMAACGSDHGTDSGLRTAGARPMASRGTQLVITTDNGVRLRPADGDRVTADRHIRGRWTHQGDTWVLSLSCPAGTDSGRPCPRMPEVDVPAGSSVSVSARNAGIDVAGVSATLDLATVNGDVTVTRSGERDGTVRLASRNGSVRAQALRAARLHAETVNGDVVLGCAGSPQHVSAATTNGSVRVTVPQDAPAYRVSARTDNGRPTVSVPTAGPAEDRGMTLTTVNGDVTALHE